MSRYLYRLARWSFHRRGYVVAFWAVVLVGMIALGTFAGGKTVNDFSIPGTPSAHGTDLLEQRIPAAAGAQTQVVFATNGGAQISDPNIRAAIEQTVQIIATGPQVASAVDPYQAETIAPNDQVAYSPVQFDTDMTGLEDSSLDAVDAAAGPARAAGLEVEFGGQVYPGYETEISELPELVGMAIAFVILMVMFGALIAAGLPILTAVVGVVISLMGVTALASIINVQSATTSLAIMLSLACGIDYALFVLTRHRASVLEGKPVADSAAHAVGTAGGAVVFAGLTVIVALCGLSVVGIPFLTIMGITAAGAVLIAVLLALTLLPALLGFAGHRVAKFVHSPVPGRKPEAIARRAVEHPQRTLGARWARFVVRFRYPLLVVGVAGLLVMAVPALSMQLGLPTGDSKPTSDTSYKAYQLIGDNFGPGANGPLTIIVDTASATDPQAVPEALAMVAQQSDVATANIAVPPQNDTTIISAIPRTAPTDPQTTDLVKNIRDQAETLGQQNGSTIYVAGPTATNIDATDTLAAALPVFLLVVVGLAMVLLTIAFRTVLVPIKSVLGFLLSVAAAFGAQVAVFQWGWLHQLFGVTPADTLSFLPIILLAIIFGLSNDYELFLVSRIKAHHAKTADGVLAVERGLGASARVVSAAALIMVGVFSSFVFTSDPIIKALGFSLAVGVLVDAFVVRLTIVPAVMAIARGRIWYHPKWFGRVVPDFDIEGERLEHELQRSDD
ncbi:MMPL family transporter [Rhodococcus sp. NPDC058521]|uniref:MMPL family transporter n=1 Tax=Rhodococcus sp. NPDC058521 TaxID=3346536 RepID=UPI003669EEF9